jgi:hypothetical protein
VTGAPAVEAESELVKVIVQVVEAGRSLVGTEQPPLEEGDNQVDAREQLGGRLLPSPAQNDRTMVVAGGAQVGIAQ